MSTPLSRIQPSPPSQSDPSSFPGNAFIIPAVSRPVGTSPSPVLGALGQINNNPESETVLRTDAWAKSIPFGKSPPNDVLDPAFASGSPRSVPTTLERAAFASSTSPPPAAARPISYGQIGFTSSPSILRPIDMHIPGTMSACDWRLIASHCSPPACVGAGSSSLPMKPSLTTRLPLTCSIFVLLTYASEPG